MKFKIRETLGVEMEMEIQSYNAILKAIKEFKGLPKSCLSMLRRNFPEYSSDTLYSILFLEHQKRMKALHMKGEAIKNKYWQMYRKAVECDDSPGVLLRIAEESDVAPCLVARLVLQKYLEETGNEADDQSKMTDYLRNTSLINDLDLSYEVFLCGMYDIMYSPLSETMKQSLGQQYEIKLLNEVSHLRLAFRDEEQLRRTGYDKTPDVKLEVPVAMDGFIVNWIESKALFGEPVIHKEYLKNQYASYWNRFGSGLIIYWFGFVESIVETNDKRFMIRSSLPASVAYIVRPKNECSETVARYTRNITKCVDLCLNGVS